MITIEITRTTVEKYTATENFITKKTPTDKVDNTGYGDAKRVYAEEYQAQTVDKQRETKHVLLRQEITDEASFDLAAVIVAVNGLGTKP